MTMRVAERANRGGLLPLELLMRLHGCPPSIGGGDLLFHVLVISHGSAPNTYAMVCACSRQERDQDELLGLRVEGEATDGREGVPPVAVQECTYSKPPARCHGTRSRPRPSTGLKCSEKMSASVKRLGTPRAGPLTPSLGGCVTRTSAQSPAGSMHSEKMSASDKLPEKSDAEPSTPSLRGCVTRTSAQSLAGLMCRRRMSSFVSLLGKSDAVLPIPSLNGCVTRTSAQSLAGLMRKRRMSSFTYSSPRRRRLRPARASSVTAEQHAVPAALLATALPPSAEGAATDADATARLLRDATATCRTDVAAYVTAVVCTLFRCCGAVEAHGAFAANTASTPEEGERIGCMAQYAARVLETRRAFRCGAVHQRGGSGGSGAVGRRKRRIEG